MLSMASEFWAQYLRAQKHLSRGRGKNWLLRASAFFGRRFPGLAGYLQVAYAYLVDSRRRPAPRERI